MGRAKKSDADIAIAYPPCDRYKSNYSSWQHFVIENVPEDKYPLMREQYLK
jgi:hypothetical protein